MITLPEARTGDLERSLAVWILLWLQARMIRQASVDPLEIRDIPNAARTACRRHRYDTTGLSVWLTRPRGGREWVIVALGTTAQRRHAGAVL